MDTEVKKEVAPVIGIDLGTTYSCVGVWQDDQVQIIPNELGNRTTPSCVAFTDVERCVGDGAKNRVVMNPTNTIYDSKRLIGRRFHDAIVQHDMKLWPFKIVSGLDDKPEIVVRYNNKEKHFSAEEISSMILIKMKEIAEAYLCTPVTSAVISVPAYFNDLQRQATMDAAKIAHLDVTRIINEPTAAALAYGLTKKADKNGEINVLIFDLGGGTFDVSLITISKGGTFTVKASGGDSHLGGEDFNHRIVKHFVEEFKRKHKLDISENQRAVGRLRVECEKAKRMLSSTIIAPIEIDYLYEGIDYSTRLSRAKFEELNMDLFDKCMKAVSQCLTDAKMNKGSVSEVVLVGGSTRIPRIQVMLKEFFERTDLHRGMNPDEAVAYGATVQALMLSSNGNEKVQDFRLIEVTPLSLGIEVKGELMSVVIPRNTVIPVTKERNYTTGYDNQTSVRFSVFQGERAISTGNEKLGEFVVGGIPPAPRHVPKLKCCFDMDVNGILSVSAEDTKTGKREMITIGHEKRKLSRKEIDDMIEDACEYKYQDEEQKKRMEAVNALENYVYVTRKRLNEIDARLNLLPQEGDKMDNALAEALDWLDGNTTTEAKEFVEKMEHLEEIRKPIIAQLYKRQCTDVEWL